MARGKQEKPKELSLRDKIKEFRRELHGDRAGVFDAAFIAAAGGNSSSLKEALTNGQGLQKAFVVAKQAVSAMPQKKSEE